MTREMKTVLFRKSSVVLYRPLIIKLESKRETEKQREEEKGRVELINRTALSDYRRNEGYRKDGKLRNACGWGRGKGAV